MTKKEGKRRQLGRGLSSLLGDEGEDYSELDKVRLSKNVAIEYLQAGKFQPRRLFDQEEIDGLVNSIKEQGILQPILVRRHPDKPTNFEIIAGERRWRAAQEAGLHEVPVIVKEMDDSTALEIALVENLQRQDLNPLEEAEGYSRLVEEFSHTQEALAKSLGKSRSHVANMLRLLSLPDPVKSLMDKGELTAGHARALLTSKNPEELARKVVSKGLNVRQTEVLAQDSKENKKASTAGSGKGAASAKDADTLAVEKEMSELLGLGVSINYKEDKGGSLVIHYKTLEQLEDVLARLSHRGMASDEGETGDEAGAPAGGLMGLIDEIGLQPSQREEDSAGGEDEDEEETKMIESVLALIASRHGEAADTSSQDSTEPEEEAMSEEADSGDVSEESSAEISSEEIVEESPEPEPEPEGEDEVLELSEEEEGDLVLEEAPPAVDREEAESETPVDGEEELDATYSSMDLDEEEPA